MRQLSTRRKARWKEHLDEKEREFFIRVSQVMRDAMGMAGINQAELARRMGLSQGRVSQILSGKFNLNLNTVVKVIMHTGIRVGFKLYKNRSSAIDFPLTSPRRRGTKGS